MHTEDHMRIPEKTPAVFLVHTSDDPVARAENSVVMYLTLKRANVAAKVHVYGRGGHGGGSLQTGGRNLDYLEKGNDNRRACSLYLSLMDKMV